MLENVTFIDLTHFLDSHVPTWTGSCGFSHEIKMDYDQGLRVLSYRMQAGIGTHIDSPSHFFKDTANVGDIPLEHLIVPAYVMDLSHERNPDLLITAKHIAEFEKKVGKIAKGSLFIAYTGWEKMWKETASYRNEDEKGRMHFPGLLKESAELLVERDVVGIGIDTLSPDGTNEGFPVHDVILGSGRYILENLVHLDKMPASGSYVIALPMKVREGTESAVRAVGLVPKFPS